MSFKDRTMIHSVVTPEVLKLFVSTYRIPSGLYPRLSGPSEPVTLSSFKMELLRHYGIQLSQHFYHLRSNGDWFTFEKRKDSFSLPCYSFMPTSTYPKE
ncbi:hypothetical protein Hanom_Chr16g01425881 [Helianthus anomalus]